MPITMSGGITFSGGMSMTPPPPPTDLTMIYNATALSSGNLIQIPLKGTVNVSVDWGDGTSNTFNAAGYANKRYTASGNYTVKISGTLTGLGLANLGAVANGNRLLQVVTFGDVGLTDLSGAFNNCASLTTVPNSLPANVSNLAYTFANCDVVNDANITSWDTSKVSNLTYTFYNAFAFNCPIGSWNVSNVSNLTGTFFGANAFAQSLSGWNVSNVTTLRETFYAADKFNSNIASWNVSKVTSLYNTFGLANTFNQPIDSWDTANVTSMFRVFSGAKAFNQPIGNWNTRNVSNLDSAFQNATIFNQDLTTWCVSNVSANPNNWNSGSALTTANSPYWGACPALVPSSTITLVGTSSNAGSTVTLPAHQAGDVFVAFAFRGNSGTAPSAATNWTGIQNLGNATTGVSMRAEYRIAANNTMPNPTWTNATNAIVLVYRGANATTPIAMTGSPQSSSYPTNSFASTTSITYPANPYWYGDSWVVAFSGHNQGDGNMQVAPTSLTARANVTNSTTNDVAGAFDSNGLFGKWANTTANIGGTNGNGMSIVLRLLPTLS